MQIMAMNGSGFYNNIWPKFSETANKVVNASLPLFEKLSATYIACRRKKQYILPDKLLRSEILNSPPHNNFIWEKIIDEISKAYIFTIQVLL